MTYIRAAMIAGFMTLGCQDNVSLSNGDRKIEQARENYSNESTQTGAVYDASGMPQAGGDQAASEGQSANGTQPTNRTSGDQPERASVPVNVAGAFLAAGYIGYTQSDQVIVGISCFTDQTSGQTCTRNEANNFINFNACSIKEENSMNWIPLLSISSSFRGETRSPRMYSQDWQIESTIKFNLNGYMNAIVSCPLKSDSNKNAQFVINTDVPNNRGTLNTPKGEPNTQITNADLENLFNSVMEYANQESNQEVHVGIYINDYPNDFLIGQEQITAPSDLTWIEVQLRSARKTGDNTYTFQGDYEDTSMSGPLYNLVFDSHVIFCRLKTRIPAEDVPGGDPQFYQSDVPDVDNCLIE